MEEPPLSDNGTPADRPGATHRSVTISVKTDDLIKRLSKHYGTSHIGVIEGALILLQDRVDGIDLLQIPELVASIADLEETVGQVVFRAEQLQRLTAELATIEITRDSDA